MSEPQAIEARARETELENSRLRGAMRSFARHNVVLEQERDALSARLVRAEEVIEAARDYRDAADWYCRCFEDGAGRDSLGAAKAGYDMAKDKLGEAVAVFVSGQEEPK